MARGLVPTKIKLLWRIYRIVYRPMSSETNGEWKDDGTITLDSSLEEKQRLETLLHELGHAICHHFDLKIKGEEEERVVEVFAQGWLSLIHDNPGLLTYISRTLK